MCQAALPAHWVESGFRRSEAEGRRREAALAALAERDEHGGVVYPGPVVLALVDTWSG